MKLTFTVFILSVIMIVAKNKGSHADSDYESDESDQMDLTKQVFDLTGTLRKHFAMEAVLTNPQSSVVCSPLSGLMPLGKLALGAEGVCFKELTQAIGGKKSKFKSNLKWLIRELDDLPGVTMDIASRIYVSKHNRINEYFQSKAKSIFKSSIEKVDFDSPTETVKIVNQWVAGKTNDMITNLLSVSDISPSMSVLLVNAVYFSGKWKLPFDNVHKGPFYAPGGQRRVPFMTREGFFKYAQSSDLDAQLIEIPYFGEKASFVVVLPNEQDGINSLVHKLKQVPDLLNKAMTGMRTRKVLLTIPKFKVQTELDLGMLYQKIGVNKMFDQNDSGLTGIVEDETVFVSKGIQKAVIEVTEEGTEAAAASAMAILKLSKTDPVTFRAEHPFLFFIKAYDQQLFAGTYVE